MRFYLKYIEKNKGKIERGHFKDRSIINSLPGWDSIISLQFENLVLNNRSFIWQKLNLSPEDIISDNPYFQRAKLGLPGCQIDYLIQTRANVLYACEVKFSKAEIKLDIINEVEKKRISFHLPRGFSYLPILIHVNGISDALLEKEYFYKFIDFGELLN